MSLFPEMSRRGLGAVFAAAVAVAGCDPGKARYDDRLEAMAEDVVVGLACNVSVGEAFHLKRAVRYVPAPDEDFVKNIIYDGVDGHIACRYHWPSTLDNPRNRMYMDVMCRGKGWSYTFFLEPDFKGFDSDRVSLLRNTETSLLDCSVIAQRVPLKI